MNHDPAFSYQHIKGQKALVFWYGKQIMILSGKQYARLLDAEATGDAEAVQLALAKLTGHFKHGNER